MKVCRMIGILALSVVLSSCASRQASLPEQQEFAGVSRIEGVSLETIQKEPKIASGYENIVLNPIQMSSQLATYYPETANLLQISMFSHLNGKKTYKHVEAGDADGYQYKGKTLIVDIKVIDMRIVSTGARIWAGAMAGASYMDVYLKLTDAASQKIVHEKVIATHNNAFASAWALGSENSLPMDMGIILGEYLYTVAPAI